MSTTILPFDPARGQSAERILRYTLTERVIHWIAGLAYIYVLDTGLAFWTPVLFWVADLVGGGPTARFWHPWFGLLWFAAVRWMFVASRREMRTTDADREWNKHIGEYIRNEDENLPPIGGFIIHVYMGTAMVPAYCLPGVQRGARRKALRLYDVEVMLIKIDPSRWNQVCVATNVESSKESGRWEWFWA
jgi:hypothetical protein